MSAPGASRNWCENVAFHHERFAAPETLEDVQSAVAAATALRALGSGHSFSALCRSEGTLPGPHRPGPPPESSSGG